MDIKKILTDKADRNGDGKVDLADISFAIDVLKTDRHLVALYGFAVGVLITLLLVHLFGK